jgi:FkbM family methyltransferase
MTWRRALKKIDLPFPNQLVGYFPPRWLFRRQVVKWTGDPALRRQLPLLYRALGIYCSLYFKIMPQSSYLPLGSVLVKALSVIQSLLPDDGYRRIEVGDVQICLDMTDSRFLKVVNELKSDWNTSVLGDVNEEVELIIPDAYSGKAGLFSDFSGASDHHSDKVYLRRFDDYMHGVDFAGKVFIKLDIEGSEYKFLRGASKIIRHKTPYILMEINPVSLKASNASFEDLRSLLSDVGYKNYVCVEDMSKKYPIDSLSFKNQRNIVVVP